MSLGVFGTIAAGLAVAAVICWAGAALGWWLDELLGKSVKVFRKKP